jgi:hypothetical protein
LVTHRIIQLDGDRRRWSGRRGLVVFSDHRRCPFGVGGLTLRFSDRIGLG